MRKFSASVGAMVIATLPLVGAGAAEAAVPTCFGQPATIVGTPGDDTLIGQSGVSDVIWAGGGDDYVLGGDFYGDDEVPGAAPDLICGGAGNDVLRGSPGDDRVSGGDGDDLVDAFNGADVELGDAGNDRLGRGSFADADAADDTMRGGPGDDVLAGGWGADRMFGNGGADELYDSECDGPTFLNGGVGDDHLESYSSSSGGYGSVVCSSTRDHLIGGNGADTAMHDSLDHVSSVEDDTLVTEPTG